MVALRNDIELTAAFAEDRESEELGSSTRTFHGLVLGLFFGVFLWGLGFLAWWLF